MHLIGAMKQWRLLRWRILRKKARSSPLVQELLNSWTIVPIPSANITNFLRLRSRLGAPFSFFFHSEISQISGLEGVTPFVIIYIFTYLHAFGVITFGPKAFTLYQIVDQGRGSLLAELSSGRIYGNYLFVAYESSFHLGEVNGQNRTPDLRHPDKLPICQLGNFISSFVAWEITNPEHILFMKYTFVYCMQMAVLIRSSPLPVFYE